MNWDELYKKEVECFKDAQERIKRLGVLEGITVSRFDEWTEEKGCIGFPIKFSIEYKIEDKADVFIQLCNSSERTSFKSIEIVSIDTKPRFQNQGYGRRLLEQVEMIAKELHVFIYGDILAGAKTFYEKCGYEIKGGQFIKYFDRH
jgi:GNAT superfamily N-acetyltransferase